MRLEEHLQGLTHRLRERQGGRPPIVITPYRGFWTSQRLYSKGRVLEDRGITPAAPGDSTWHNFVNMYKRFCSNEIPYARALVRFQGREQEVVANSAGLVPPNTVARIVADKQARPGSY